MVSLMTCKLVALVLLLSTSLSRANRLEPDFQIHVTPKTHVLISNLFEDGSSLIVHCKSGDDDLGQQVVTAGKTYEFVFYPNIFFMTRFFWRFTLPKGWQQVDVYHAVRDMKRCYGGTVGGDGIKGLNMIGFPDIVYNWKTS